ncbi:MAG: PAS domain S-box protein [Smithellaceae bacterium]|nr:PAS domain S-box protein [Syntrophaceae bacterium]MDD4241771.1 PAS domain S-box protein [Smithellaceae bacterium]NLX50794.1 PAS domain S-box protein [Deltaproteobacteria bacterium]
MKSKPDSFDRQAPEIASLRRELEELRLAKNGLKESEERLKSVVSRSPIPAFVISKDHRILYWNKALAQLTKIRAEDVIGTSQQWRAFYGKKRPCMADLLVSRAQEKISKWYTGKYTKSKLLDEAYEAIDFFPELGHQGKWLRFTAAIIRNESGELIGAIETLEDITRRKKAKEALLRAHKELEERVQERTAELAQANEALLTELMERHRTQKALKQTTDHLSLLLESLPIISYTRKANENFGITFVSSTIEEITGYPPRCFIEEENFWTDHIHPDDRPRILDELKAGQAKGTHRYSYRFRVMDDSYRWFSDYWRVVQLPAGSTNYIVGAWQDVTEDKRIRQEGELRLQQMIQTHKLTALGEVVAGVAHEINNPVSFIAYNVPILEEIWSAVETILSRSSARHPDWEKRGLSFEEVCRNMQEIIQAFKIGANRISRVVTSLKEFSRSDETAQKKLMSVPEVIAGALVIVGAQIRRTVSKIEQDIADDVLPVSGQFQKIEQVIANLLINAHQAIPAGRKGLITIRCRYIERLKAVVVDIEDNGKGIDRKIMDQIFDPFFTTRRDRDGTGLGLSISYGLIREHHGLISVLSRPGRGSRFSLYLPVDGETDISLYPAILCIDHNVKYLKELKANFVDAVIWRSEAQDKPEDILQFLIEHPEVDLIVSEVRLKGFTGWALLEKIHAKFPLLPVILYSADRKALVAPPQAKALPDYTLHKPFSIDKLQKIIHDVGRQQL